MTVAGRHPDQEFEDGVEPLKDSSGTLGTSTADPDIGWHAKRFVEFAETSEGGAVRHIARDKEYAFRPKFAKLVHRTLTYRDFREPPDAPSRAAASPNSVTFGVQQTGAAGAGTGPWIGSAETFGFEIGLMSDVEIGDYLKTRPDFNPSHPNGRNRSTLIHSGKALTRADRDADLPPTYFGREHDLVIVRQTQDVKLKRVRFDPPGPGHLKRRKRIEDYQDAFWKAMWNITPFDQPFETNIEQENEERGGPQKHGFKAHDYSSAISAESIIVPRPVFQGGWMHDMVLDVVGQIHDVIGIGRGAPYRRYLARDTTEVATVYVRHDAIFARTPSILGRIHFQDIAQAIEPWGLDFWADPYLDTEAKGADGTRLAPHETGQWRIRYKNFLPDVPTVPVKPPINPGDPGRPPVPTPGGESQPPQPPDFGGDVATPGGGGYRFQPGEFEGVEIYPPILNLPPPIVVGDDDKILEVELPLRVESGLIAPGLIEIAFVFHAVPDCPPNPPPPFTELPRVQIDDTKINDEGYCKISFPISGGHVRDLDGGFLRAGIWQTSNSTSAAALIMGDPRLKMNPPGTTGKKAPSVPANLDQLNASLVSIPPGGSTSDTTITFEGDITEPDLELVALEVELVKTSGAFQSTATKRGAKVSSGGTALVAISGLSPGTYKWRARSINDSGIVSSWAAFADPSFTIT